MNNSGIYKILNLSTDKFYIGSAKNLRKRFYEHKRVLNKNEHPNRYLQFAWNKYWGNFEFIILEYVKDEIMLTVREQYYIDTLKPEYNLAPSAASMLGFKHSDETKLKLSAFGVNEAHIRRARILGRKHSEETKKKLSIARRKRIIKLETRIKLAKSGTGRKFSEEAKRKISLSKIGKPRSDKTKQKIRETLLKNNRKILEGVKITSWPN